MRRGRCSLADGRSPEVVSGSNLPYGIRVVSDRVSIFAVCASLVAVLLWAPAVAAESGRELAQRVYDRPDGRDATTQGRMILVEKGSQPRIRHMYVYRRDSEGGRVESLIRFTSPPDIENTGLLTLDHPGAESDQWIYLPALDRSRRIASSRKGGRFVGSDLYYEDLRDRPVEHDDHRLLGTESIMGAEAQVLESVPVDDSNSVYGKRVSWIHPQTLLPLRVDFFDKAGKLVKRSSVHRIEKIDGYWTVMDSTVTDLASGHQTRLIVDKIAYDRDLPDALFSRAALEDPERERAYRP